MDFYHATHPENVAKIVASGFRLPFFEYKGHVSKWSGFPGQGVYISPDWKIALWFNHAVLRVRSGRYLPMMWNSEGRMPVPGLCTGRPFQFLFSCSRNSHTDTRSRSSSSSARQ